MRSPFPGGPEESPEDWMDDMKVLADSLHVDAGSRHQT
jgi:hypothetical protein